MSWHPSNHLRERHKAVVEACSELAQALERRDAGAYYETARVNLELSVQQLLDHLRHELPLEAPARKRVPR